MLVCLLVLVGAALTAVGQAKVLTPPYINIAAKSRVEASYTCGEGVEGTELYCKLVGANQGLVDNIDVNIIQGQVCDVCNISDPLKYHPPSAAVDGTEAFWMSPPLSRGMEYSQVNFTIDLGQEFHVAYIIIKMGISPRPGVWILEKSSDNGQTFTPWQYFADSELDCEKFFGRESLQPITKDDSVICDTRYSKILPLEDGEIVVSLLNDRPSANDFFNSTVLQEWTRATNVKLRLMRTKTLFAHLMSLALKDPSVTRRYFYSIRDISIGGRCRCNGHAEVCPVVGDNYKRVCECKHNTCGDNCELCCDNKVQKKWRQSKSNKLFECEDCNCHGHSNQCAYNETVDALSLSLDKYGRYEGGGVCQNCQDNTEGINCDRCKPGYYRPRGRLLTSKDVCERCKCDDPRHTGNCADSSGICECEVNYQPPFCDSCAYGYFGFPTCKNCTCYINGTEGGVCEPDSQVSTCVCNPNFDGDDCRKCRPGYYNFPECSPCQCNPVGSLNEECNVTTGQCDCQSNFGGPNCNQCANSYYNFPACSFCKCDPRGTTKEVCDKDSGRCLCKEGFGGERCDRCIPGYKEYPDCKPCGCSDIGSSSKVCDHSGKCSCLVKFSGKTCTHCAFGFYRYPECLSCNCNTQGTLKNAISCDDNAQCECKEGIEGKRCDICKEGLYNFPTCEVCDCDPAGVRANSSDCGTLSKVGELCQCKPRVTGRKCKECQPLFWNLQHYNPLGCEECNCNSSGVLGGIGECDSRTGQCYCKQNVQSRKCNVCVDGSYSLEGNNIFGCTDCSCDIGGSLDNTCSNATGDCPCRPRVTGRTCNQPMLQHYFPTLYQFKYEMEDGYTPDRRPLNYDYDDSVFPGYSWRGFAVFTPVEGRIKQEVLLNSDSLHYIILRYVNRNEFPVTGLILARHEDEEPLERKIVFKPSFEPTFAMTVGAGNIPLPLVTTVQGKWEIEIAINQSLFVDYFVLIPQSYYEGNILIEPVKVPCKRGDEDVCKQYSYPSVDAFDTVYGDSAYVIDEGARESVTDLMNWDSHEGSSKVEQLPVVSPAQPELRFDIRLRRREPSFIVFNYGTPGDTTSSSELSVLIETGDGTIAGKVTLNPCPYTWLCRQPLLHARGQLALFNFNQDVITVVLSKENPVSSSGIESVSVIPYNKKTSLGYIKPSPVCVMRNGICQNTFYETPIDVKKVEFESGANEGRRASKLPPRLQDPDKVNLIFLDKDDPNIDIGGKVPSPGNYTFIVHYYQPHHPDFNLDVLVHNGETYEATLPLVHCPNSAGCRSVITNKDGSKPLPLNENFLISLNVPEDRSVWLDYVLVVPDVKFSKHLTIDKSEGSIGRFLKECTENFFYVDGNLSDFCRSSIFSLTTHFNNGALRCECNADGSWSLQCETFGGQCKCRNNIIGRRCERCKTGFYDFPDCKKCNCPESSLCDEVTGQCTCPPNVIGEFCDQCAENTYGYFPRLGCKECECEYVGLKDGNAQCDPVLGTCSCKENIMGRRCDQCDAGYSFFPHCERCDCDLRGTISHICDNSTGVCLCKENVESEVCDICREGSFNLQSKNKHGCTKCFCFERSRHCSSSRLYRTNILSMKEWKLATILVRKPLIEINPLPNIPDETGLNSIGVVFDDPNIDDKVYFNASPAYLGNRLTSYGGYINYKIFTTAGTFEPPSSVHPDVILTAGGFNLLYYSEELPPADQEYEANIEITESNFILSTNNLQATRPQLMQVLRDLRGVYIKSNYYKDSFTTKLMDVKLSSGGDDYSDLGQALSVEQCRCEPQYTGLSCEECAPGYYRSHDGPYGGFCIPCQCHGHAATCDKLTGICIDCQHNTTGDHCEKCAIGYHGDARIGSPYDCLICACPLPIQSNNFAVSCEVSPDGESISCNCKEGYYGSRCQSCAVGFFGQPELEYNGLCKPCDCSGNIDTREPGACDSITGECIKCLNNTYGEACRICAPGYFGDAVVRKDCQSCVCDKCGTKECDHESGTCICQPNVAGETCDSCLPDHYGFKSCQGCRSCNCGLASLDSQCDVDSGNCRCKPGVTGRACDQCDHGYWRYTSEGCTLCSCNLGYSIGAGCNPNTGKCECLPGVIGEKCDHCPHRWVLEKGRGCSACDKCIDDLLDSVDTLHNTLAPIANEFESVEHSYFTRKKLIFINESVDALRPNVSSLRNIEVDFVPIEENFNSLLGDVDKLKRRTEYLVGKTNSSMDENMLRDAKKTDDLVITAITEARRSVAEVMAIAESFKEGGVAKYGLPGSEFEDFVKEAKKILEKLQSYNPQYMEDDIRLDQLGYANKLLNLSREMKEPIDAQANLIKNLTNNVQKLDLKLDDLNKYSRISLEKARKLNDNIKKNREQNITEKFKTIKSLEESSHEALKEANKVLKDTRNILDLSASDLYGRLRNNQTEWEDLSTTLSSKVNSTLKDLDTTAKLVSEALEKAEDLEEQGEELKRLEKGYQQDRNAIQAYKDIINTLRDALITANNAKLIADNATDLSKGLKDKAFESKDKSTLLYNQARDALSQSQREPELDEAKKKIENLETMKEDFQVELDETENNLGKTWETINSTNTGGMNVITEAEKGAVEVKERIKDIVEDLPQKIIISKQIQDNAKDGETFVHETSEKISQVNTVLPEIMILSERLEEVPKNAEASGNELKGKLEELRKQVELAREVANNIKLGATFYRNTTLELPNPPNLPEQGVNNVVSFYFNPKEQNGLLFFLGNEAKKTRKRSVASGDFMALEIQSGKPKLTVDLGSGATSLICDDLDTADGVWYQAKIERTGKSLKLTVTRLGDNESCVKTGIINGSSAILNLDKAHSKIFVGGFPANFNSPPELTYNSYVGKVEDLIVDDSPVGLWNFQETANLFPAHERNLNITTTAPTGFRFNGDGYVALDSKLYRISKKSEIILQIKTFSKEGLLFLSHKDGTFLSIELREGRILYQFDLGSGIVSLLTSSEYNDGEWHSIEASRVDKRAILKVDGKLVEQNMAPGGTKLEIPQKLYFGGFPGEHNIFEVTESDFDGCIDQVQMDGTSVDLSKNLEASGVITGCPPKVANMVSFEEGARGYVLWPNFSAPESMELILRFKTSSPHGILAHANNGVASASLLLSDGQILFRTGEVDVVKTESINPYNDSNWHVVMASYDINALQLYIDDYDSYRSSKPPSPMRMLHGNLYFGGVPSSVHADLAFSPHFSGCISDATLNGIVINFGNLTETPEAVIGKCLEQGKRAPFHRTPPLPPTRVTEKTTIIDETTIITTTEKVEQGGGVTVVESTERTKVSETSRSDHPPQCKLPLYPISTLEPDISAYKIGTKPGSRLEFSNTITKMKQKFDFSIDVKSRSDAGLIFYAADDRNIDFIGVFLSQGQVNFRFDCGSGPAHIKSDVFINDYNWHTIRFQRFEDTGTLMVDGAKSDGRYEGHAKNLNVRSTYYVGGIDPALSLQTDNRDKILSNLMGVNGSLNGCLRNFKINNNLIKQPSKKVGADPCDTVFNEVFFYPDGGYVKLVEQFKVGKRMDIEMDVKPRALSGLLLTVQSKNSYFVLELDNGTVRMSVDLGNGEITTAYTSTTDPYQLCDGNWHTIKGWKSLNIVTLAVDNNYTPPATGTKKGRLSDTKHTLYLGGHPYLRTGRVLNGVRTKEQFVGCMRNIKIKSQDEKIQPEDIIGNVTGGVCPSD